MGIKGPLRKTDYLHRAALGVITACNVSLQGSQMVSKCDDVLGPSSKRDTLFADDVQTLGS